MVELQKISWDNWEACAKLEVHDDQKGFVASNLHSLAQCYVAQLDADRYPPMAFAMHSNGAVVGFVLMYYNIDNMYDDGTFDLPYYAISRFMIDKNHQGKGLGKAAMAAVLEHLRTMPHGLAAAVYISYTPENGLARGLYKSFGFVETGQVINGETVAKLVL